MNGVKLGHGESGAIFGSDEQGKNSLACLGSAVGYAVNGIDLLEEEAIIEQTVKQHNSSVMSGLNLLVHLGFHCGFATQSLHIWSGAS